VQDIDDVMTLFTWPLRCSLSFLKNNIQTMAARTRQHACSTRQDASYTSASTRARSAEFACDSSTRARAPAHMYICAPPICMAVPHVRACSWGARLQLSRSGRAWICFAIAELMARSGAYIYSINMTKNCRALVRTRHRVHSHNRLTVPGQSKAYS
jgi:hypothetical protein